MTGAPDNLDRLWTPHRLSYVQGDAEPRSGYQSPAGCPFCRAPHVAEDDGLVVARGEAVFAVLNLYPYNPGHLMVCPYRHVADYTDLTDAETAELASFTQQAMRVIRRVSGPDGFNLGMNQGAMAGAGIASHLHQHVVPRWAGDTNFMPVVARTKVLPQLLTDTRRVLAEAWYGVPTLAAMGDRRPTPLAPNGMAEGSATQPKRATKTATKTATTSKTRAAAETKAETKTKAEAETKTQAEAEAETKTQAEAETKAKTKAEAATKAKTKTKTKAATGTTAKSGTAVKPATSAKTAATIGRDRRPR